MSGADIWYKGQLRTEVEFRGEGRSVLQPVGTKVIAHEVEVTLLSYQFRIWVVMTKNGLYSLGTANWAETIVVWAVQKRSWLHMLCDQDTLLRQVIAKFAG